ncbi:MAG: hypothetical protein IKU61_07215, partial [Clostridia bacterium]|nr:hypothetical protein [Clostridia bacterium]
TGVFDGNGHKISGLNITGSYALGLFGFISDATVCNLTVEGSVNGTGNNVGGIVGFSCMNSTVKNCISYVDVTVTTTSNVSGCGGIVGKVGEKISGTAVIEDCINYGNVTGVVATGGILGLDQHAGAGSSTVIRNCKNYGTITGTSSCTAGIFGYYYVAVDSDLTVTGCANYGDISGVKYVAGVIGAHIANGKQDLYKIDTEIGNVYSEGKITCSNTANTGGIIGSFQTVGAGGTMDLYDFWQKGTLPVICQVQGTTPLTLTRFYNEGGSEIVTVRPATVTLDSCVVKGDTSVLASDNWTRKGGSPELVSFHTKHVYKYIPAENGHILTCFCGVTKGNLLEHRWYEEKAGFVCYDCKAETSSLAENVKLTVDGEIYKNVATVNVNLATSAAFGSILFDVTAPEGYVLTDVEFPSNSGLVFVGADKVSEKYKNPYRITAAKQDETAILGGTVKLTYECAGKESGLFLIGVSECYDSAIRPVKTAAIGNYVKAVLIDNGDVNRDGEVTFADALIMLSAIVRQRPLANADVNEDGRLSLVDVLRVIKTITM